MPMTACQYAADMLHSQVAGNRLLQLEREARKRAADPADPQRQVWAITAAKAGVGYLGHFMAQRIAGQALVKFHPAANDGATAPTEPEPSAA